MGFNFSDRNEAGMVFFRNATDHHTVALMQAKENKPLPKRGQLGFDHFALEVATVSELFKIRDFLKSKGVTITYEGRRGPGGIRVWSFSIRTGTKSRSMRPWTRSAPMARAGRQASGVARLLWKKLLPIHCPAPNTIDNSLIKRSADRMGVDKTPDPARRLRKDRNDSRFVGKNAASSVALFYDFYPPFAETFRR